MRFSLLLLAGASLGLSSCGMVRSAAQIPGRTVQSLGRTVGFRLIATEITPIEGAQKSEHAEENGETDQ